MLEAEHGGADASGGHVVGDDSEQDRPVPEPPTPIEVVPDPGVVVTTGELLHVRGCDRTDRHVTNRGHAVLILHVPQRHDLTTHFTRPLPCQNSYYRRGSAATPHR